ncbi:M6 family metalloprotease domain-containing protein [Saccharothrix texasensis]|uniref:M6 family metalloprotease-like protein n=1 Tax=Saccharothrix texasensis TaxID=103734 RepID=A0A3N1HHV0_9PSEU|nr:M6 family metalloprotease domain-containing protein [Saccharothrix texasensis]ROP42078.1 M6 family metalloprotease-like protein [Saccharothrix texasensis]
MTGHRFLLAAAVVLAAMVLPTGTGHADVPAGACALPATNAHLSEGVPNLAGSAPSHGTLRATMLFVDFPDAPATDSTTSLRDQLLPGGPDWFATSSYGGLALSVDAVTARFHRMPRPSADYGWRRGLTAEAHARYLNDALAAAGRAVSFSGTHLLYVVPTRAAGEISFAAAYLNPLTAPDGTVITRSVTFGQDTAHWGGKVLNHETGHALGLPDLYGYSGEVHRFVGGWDLMGLISGPGPDLLAWHKWKLNWLRYDQIGCVSAPGRYLDTLVPVSAPGGRKGVVVRTGATTVLVAEARSRAGLDSASCATGVLVYSVDTAVASGNGPVLVADARPRSGGCDGHELNDAPFDVGGRFHDARSNTTIDVVGRAGDDYRITIAHGVAP